MQSLELWSLPADLGSVVWLQNCVVSYRCVAGRRVFIGRFFTKSPSIDMNVIHSRCGSEAPPLPVCPRCHPQHASCSSAHRGDGVEANPAAHRHRPRNLPAAPRQPLHVEEGVPGGDGEVRKRSSRSHHHHHHHRLYFLQDVRAAASISLCNEQPQLCSVDIVLVWRNVINVALLLFLATSTTTSTQTRPRGRRSPTPATLSSRNQVNDWEGLIN